MFLLTQHDFDSVAGRAKIIKTIHRLDAKVHELEQQLDEIARMEQVLEKDLQANDPH